MEMFLVLGKGPLFEGTIGWALGIFWKVVKSRCCWSPRDKRDECAETDAPGIPLSEGKVGWEPGVFDRRRMS